MGIRKRIQRLEERLRMRAPFGVALIRPVEGGFAAFLEGRELGVFSSLEEAKEAVSGAGLVLVIERVDAERRKEHEGTPEAD